VNNLLYAADRLKDAVMATETIEINHAKYNLEAKDNLRSLPTQPAVYGIFAVIDGQPVHCRCVMHCQDLQESVRWHFEEEPHTGLRAFMQGPWIKLLVYELKPVGTTEEALAAEVVKWANRYEPYCDERGEYRYETPVES
jgi:hypothetical protein